MPLVDVEMTEQEADDILNPAPARRGYRLRVFGVRQTEEGEYTFVSEKGSRYEKVIFQIADEGPHHGKFVKDYNNVHGTGFAAQLRRALPQAFSGRSMDTDLIVGMECLGDLRISEYEGIQRNEITKLLPLPIGE